MAELLKATGIYYRNELRSIHKNGVKLQPVYEAFTNSWESILEKYTAEHLNLGSICRLPLFVPFPVSVPFPFFGQSNYRLSKKGEGDKCSVRHSLYVLLMKVNIAVDNANRDCMSACLRYMCYVGWG